MRLGPYTECGFTLATEQLIASSARAAIVVRSIVAYSDGVLFSWSFHTPHPMGDAWDEFLTGQGAGSLAIGYGYLADGTFPFSVPVATPDRGDIRAEMVSAGGGDGDSGYAYLTLWIEPRKPGTLRLAVRWPDQDIPQTRHDYAVPTDQQCQEQIIELFP